MEELQFVLYRQYKIIEDGEKWRVIEHFGSYRMLKKRFNTIAQAKKRIDVLAA